MNRRELEALLDQVTYRDWHFYVSERRDHGLYFQIRFWSPTLDGKSNWLRFSSRREVGEEKTKGEVVKMALLAVLEIEECLATERFVFMDVAVYSPFFNAGALGEVCRDSA